MCAAENRRMGNLVGAPEHAQESPRRSLPTAAVRQALVDPTAPGGKSVVQRAQALYSGNAAAVPRADVQCKTRLI